MGKTTLSNSFLHNTNKGLLNCKNCGKLICNIGKEIIAYKISYICTCGSMGSAEYDFHKPKLYDDSYAILKNNQLICPRCGTTLLTLYDGSYVNFAFRIKCRCGHTLNKYKSMSSVNNRLKEYDI